MGFSEIVCQERAVGLLQGAYAGQRVGQCYLFAGPDGVGRFLTAQAWARLLLCAEPRERDGLWDGCGTCPSCKLMAGGGHPDFQHVYKELVSYTRQGKGKTAPVDLPIAVIREFLLERAAARPTLSQRRVFVVSEAERLNASGQNALLKVLEEPPPGCCIVLLCTRHDQLLPTVRSRAQTVRFGPIAADRVRAHLVEQGASVEQAHFLAGLAQGSLGTAETLWRLSAAGADLYALKRDLVVRVARLELAHTLEVAEACVEAAKTLAEAWARVAPETSRTDLKRRAQKTVVQVLIALWRDALCHDWTPPAIWVHADQGAAVKELAGRLGPEAAADRVTLGCEALRRIEAAANERLVFEWLLLRGQGSGILTHL